MKVRSFQTKIWIDEWFADLNPTEKLAFIYYVFNERVNILYCYQVTDRIVKFDTGLNQDQLDGAKNKFHSSGKIYFFDDWIFLRNAHRYQKFEGEKNDTARETIKSEMSEKVLSWFEGIKNTPIDTPIDTPSIGSETKTKIKIEIESKIDKFRNLTKEEIQERFGELDGVAAGVDEVLEHRKAVDWLRANGKSYKDYNSFFRNWLRRSDGKKSKKGGVMYVG